jgi:methyl-accepting chemotaxis protein
MDELSKLEEELENLSHKFLNSIQSIQKHAPFISKKNEENMENSEDNKRRIEVEKIENYEEMRKNYDKLIDDSAKDIGNNFNSIFKVLNSLKEKEQFMYTEQQIIDQIKELREKNEMKVNYIKDKVKQTEEIINNISKIQMDNRMNKQILKYDFRNQQMDVDLFN